MAGGGAAALRAPFPWFGSKARVARAVWERFGDPGHYIEPFCGSAAVLLGRPGWRPGALETVNDIDGLLVNAYRAVRSAPEEVAEWASWPLSETDMLARQRWLVRRRQDLVGRLEADPWHYDAQAAGWWLWGIACWVGADTWCLGRGTTVVTTDDEGLAVTRRVGKAVDGGAPRRPVHLTGPQGVKRAGADLVAWFRALAERLADVRILCGNWRRTLAPRNVHVDNVDRSPVAVFLDPPYSAPSRYARLYVHDDASLAEQARSWCLREAPSDWRVALCGLEGEHAELEDAGWEVMAWADDADGWGRNPNRAKETLWFSPACSGPAQARLFR